MPSARLGLVPPRIHVPLMRLGLCLDCEDCFEIGQDACPACGSETWMPLARFLEAARARRVVRLVESFDATDGPVPWPTGPAHHFIIVARDREPLYRHLTDSLAGNPTIRVVLDRRRSDRHAAATGGTTERRRAERRWRLLDDQLRVFGWAVVRIDAKPAGD
jgi:hypothetical protein